MFRLFKKRTKVIPSANSQIQFDKTENNIQICVKRIDYRMFYDSEWHVDVAFFDDKGVNASHRFACNIIRSDTESAQSLENVIRSLGKSLSLASVKLIGEKQSIYYD